MKSGWTVSGREVDEKWTRSGREVVTLPYRARPLHAVQSFRSQALFTRNEIQPDKYRSVIQFSIVSMVTG